MKQRRRKKWLKAHGLWVNPKDTWSMDITFANYIIPRLKLFKKVNNGYPNELTPQLWDEYIDKMIKSFEMCRDNHFIEVFPGEPIEKFKERSRKQEQEIQEGLQLFAKYFQALWW